MKNVLTVMGCLVFVAALAAPAAAGSGATSPKTAFAAALPHYEAIHRALAGDTLDGVAGHARAIREVARKTAAEFSPAGAGVPAAKAQECRALLPDVERAADRLAGAKSLDEARKAFGQLSQPMVRYREMTTGERPYVVFCPMAKKPWLQESKKIANPYLGSKMLQCGKIVS